MLRSLKDLDRYTVSATDGDIGCVTNFLMDDERWAVRYLVVQTGGLLEERRVLISPIAFGEPDWAAKKFPVALTMDKVSHSPGIDTDKPVSRQHEQVYNGYYGNSYYWGYAGMWGLGASPSLLAKAPVNEVLPGRPEKPDDIHLRSAEELRGYHIHGSDGAIGHVEDFIIDDETWAVRYLVIDTSNWWFGKKVLVAPHWATRISWEARTVYLEMSRESIKDSPQWAPSEIIDREYETHLYDYYGRPVYWSIGHLPVEEESPHHVSADTK
jgi:sporulation protein YlmC with PRC-barrel domain